MNIPESIWYRPTGLWARLLLPLSLLFRLLSAGRRQAYRRGLLRVHRFPVPVIVVGNISVGGTGKTPLVLALLEQLQADGWKPGVVSRGYGGQAQYPLLLTGETMPAEAGDEPCLLARRSACPVVVDPVRSRAVRYLLEQADVDVVISDDGLQHYALGRDLEVAVIDGQRRFGNGLLLPAGPLRESVARLQEVQVVIVNGGRADEASMHLQQGDAIRLSDGVTRTLGSFAGQPVHAVAGIGHPQRFFDQLRAAGLEIQAHAFPDHHAYSQQDLQFGDTCPVLMTEKDAVKCTALAAGNCWYVPVKAEFNTVAARSLDRLMGQLKLLRTK